MKKLKILTVDRKGDDGYWVAGVFETDEEIAKHIELFFFEDTSFEIEEIDYEKEIKCLANGEYAYQVIVVNSETFVIEQILAPEDYTGQHINDHPKQPLRIILAAKNAADVKQKCLKIMAELTIA